MTSFSKLLKRALLAAALASFSVASPLDHATRRSIPIGSNLEIEAFHPISTFEVRTTGFLYLYVQFNDEFLSNRLSARGSTTLFLSVRNSI
jgi:hypothetical protein